MPGYNNKSKKTNKNKNRNRNKNKTKTETEKKPETKVKDSPSKTPTSSQQNHVTQEPESKAGEQSSVNNQQNESASTDHDFDEVANLTLIRAKDIVKRCTHFYLEGLFRIAVLTTAIGRESAMRYQFSFYWDTLFEVPQASCQFCCDLLRRPNSKALSDIVVRLLGSYKKRSNKLKQANAKLLIVSKQHVLPVSSVPNWLTAAILSPKMFRLFRTIIPCLSNLKTLVIYEYEYIIKSSADDQMRNGREQTFSALRILSSDKIPWSILLSRHSISFGLTHANLFIEYGNQPIIKNFVDKVENVMRYHPTSYADRDLLVSKDTSVLRSNLKAGLINTLGPRSQSSGPIMFDFHPEYDRAWSEYNLRYHSVTTGKDLWHLRLIYITTDLSKGCRNYNFLDGSRHDGYCKKNDELTTKVHHLSSEKNSRIVPRLNEPAKIGNTSVCDDVIGEGISLREFILLFHNPESQYYKEVDKLVTLIWGMVVELVKLHANGIMNGNLNLDGILIDKYLNVKLVRGSECHSTSENMLALGYLIFFCFAGREYNNEDMANANSRNYLNQIYYSVEALDLIRKLLKKSAERPTALEVYNHPLFWCPEKKLFFIQHVCSRLKVGGSEKIIAEIEKISNVVFGKNWRNRFDKKFLNAGTGWYNHKSMHGLLKKIRNYLAHSAEDPTLPQYSVCYFPTQFPKLIPQLYHVMKRECGTENGFQQYFQQSPV